MTSAAKWPVGIGVLVVLLIAAALIASNSAHPRQALAECVVQALRLYPAWDKTPPSTGPDNFIQPYHFIRWCTEAKGLEFDQRRTGCVNEETK